MVNVWPIYHFSHTSQEGEKFQVVDTAWRELMESCLAAPGALVVGARLGVARLALAWLDVQQQRARAHANLPLMALVKGLLLHVLLLSKFLRWADLCAAALHRQVRLHQHLCCA